MEDYSFLEGFPDFKNKTKTSLISVCPKIILKSFFEVKNIGSLSVVYFFFVNLIKFNDKIEKFKCDLEELIVKIYQQGTLRPWVFIKNVFLGYRFIIFIQKPPFSLSQILQLK